MNVQSFLITCESLARAENACICHFTELMLQRNPSRQDVEAAARLVKELGKIHSDALNGLALHASLPQAGEVSTLLKRSAITLTESLLMLDEIAIQRDFS
jgi:hypothetical protein